VSAMTTEPAGGKRLLGTGEALWVKEVAAIIAKAYPDLEKLPLKDMPDFAARAIALFDDRLKSSLPFLGIAYDPDNSKTQALSKIIMRPAKESILASAASILGR